MKKSLSKIAIMLTMLCVAVFAQQKGSFKDSRDGKTYKTVKIGNQTWMAENLNYEAKGSKCYENKPAYCKKYGRLYINSAECPKGWHIPDNLEWETLMYLAGGRNSFAGKKLKSRDGWDDYEDDNVKKSGNGTDDFGFSALPSGYGYHDYDGSFKYDGIGSEGYWFEAYDVNEDGDGDGAYYWNMWNTRNYVGRNPSKGRRLCSIRCVEGKIDHKKIGDEYERAKAEYEKTEDYINGKAQ